METNPLLQSAESLITQSDKVLLCVHVYTVEMTNSVIVIIAGSTVTVAKTQIDSITENTQIDSICPCIVFAGT